MTIIGAFAALFFLIKGVKPHIYKGAIYFIVGEDSWGGIDLGPFFFMDKYFFDGNVDYDSIGHEWGHSIQNIIFGPLFPLLIGVPSLIRATYRTIVIEKGIKKYSDLPDYDAIWFEGWATAIGRKYR